ncbi:Alpha/Beta hydrolase protein [Kockiozyma suomiensis]|uniref:Alpha/Beta hydrolase protein n=1 Tax=Kockiozyma suomiensis TaxID=1337062 RepID=UPI003343AEF6
MSIPKEKVLLAVAAAATGVAVVGALLSVTGTISLPLPAPVKYLKFKKNSPRSNPPASSYPDYANSEHTFVSPSSGRTISYAEYGSADSENIVVYEHGNPGSRVLPIGASLKGKDIRVLTMDRPGLGFTSLPVLNKTIIETAVSDVGELLEYLGLDNKKIILCGFSAGGPHVLAILKTFPEKIRAVYCLGPASYFDDEATWSQLTPGAASTNKLALRHPNYYFYKLVSNADAITDCSNVIENMKGMSPPGDKEFLATHPVEALGWQYVNYEAFRQGIWGYALSCVEIFGATLATKPWPVLGDLSTIEGIKGIKVTIIHRESDLLVALSGSRQLVEMLKAAGADATLIVPEGPEGGHFQALNYGFDYILEQECKSA